MKKKCVMLATVLAVLAAGTGCTENDMDEIAYVPPEAERYENHIEIEGQWGASAATGEDGQYGIGDPFVMRWNGKYYLYPSTSDPCDGIKVFESDDLIHWTYRGMAVAESEATVHGAYAPEVVYYNGYFYLCQSRAGQGHYIYRSESPTEGFELISKTENGTEGDLNYGNLGMGIDGSFYVSDDGKLYLLHTSTPAGLKYNEITDVENICGSTIGATGTLGNANLNHWIEGPGIFRRGDFSYLTYTGNHVTSKGYRVAYSYAEDLSSLSGFVQPKDNVTIMDTADEHSGLGHASNVTGPDLDSVYTAYHSLVGAGPARRYNVDRYFAWGGLLTANGVTHRPVFVPDAPDAQAQDESGLTRSSRGYVLGETEDFFTAEFNFIAGETNTLFFGGDRYTVTVGADAVTLSSGGTVLAQKQIALPVGKLNTVRVENGDGVGYLYLNGMRVISYAAEAAPGELGYGQTDGIRYTAFTNDVFGTSDFEAVKNFPTKFPAVTYLKGERRGFSIADAARVQGGVRVGEKQSVSRVGDDYAVMLERRDWVKYAVDIPSDGTYSLAATVTRASAGAELTVTIGDTTLECTIPETAGEGDTVKVTLGRMQLSGGVDTMKVRVEKGSVGLIMFETHENAGDAAVSLADFQTLRGDVVNTGSSVVLTGGSQDAVALWGNAGVADFEATVTYRAHVGVGSNLGIMIRAEHYSWHASQPTQSWRGYYLELGSQIIELSRYDYSEEMMQATRYAADENEHTLTIRAQSNRITILLDGKQLFSVEDDCAFVSGRLGAFVSSGSLEILGLTFTAL